MDILNIIYEVFNESLTCIIQIARIVIPLMVVLQLVKELKLYDKFSFILNPLVRIFKMSKYTILPLMAGLFFGIAYGGGLIIQTAREGLITKRDIYLMVIFLSIFHSIFEDNILFVAIGADPYIVFLGRLFLAFLVTLLFSKLWKVKSKRRPEPEGDYPVLIDYKSYKE
ncbi:MAG: Nucleoside recognition domain protein [Clostridia bacterium 41_269]|nr:MAG: Nucleoside recognition domain protein [Clostridia bacterium 41_269]